MKVLPPVGVVSEVLTLLPEVPIHARLRECVGKWLEIGVNNTVLAWIKFGLTWEFLSQPVPVDHPEIPLGSEKQEALDAEMIRFQRLGAVEVLPIEDFRGSYFFYV